MDFKINSGSEKDGINIFLNGFSDKCYGKIHFSAQHLVFNTIVICRVYAKVNRFTRQRPRWACEERWRIANWGLICQFSVSALLSFFSMLSKNAGVTFISEKIDF